MTSKKSSDLKASSAAAGADDADDDKGIIRSFPVPFSSLSFPFVSFRFLPSHFLFPSLSSLSSLSFPSLRVPLLPFLLFPSVLLLPLSFACLIASSPHTDAEDKRYIVLSYHRSDETIAKFVSSALSADFEVRQIGDVASGTKILLPSMKNLADQLFCFLFCFCVCYRYFISYCCE